MEKIRLHIPNITCSHCVMTIKNELNEMEGVKDVQGDPQTKDVAIEFEKPASREAIEALLEEINYPSRLPA